MPFFARRSRRARASRGADLNYGPIGVTMPGSRSARSVAEVATRIGGGEAVWREARRATLSWGIQRGAGYTITVVGRGAGGRGARAQPARFVEPGQTVTLRRRFGIVPVSMSVRVVSVVDEPDRSGFAFGTLSGHPLAGEAAFIIERRPDNSVWFLLRSTSRPAGVRGVLAYPMVLFLRPRLEASYRRALTRQASVI